MSSNSNEGNSILVIDHENNNAFNKGGVEVFTQNIAQNISDIIKNNNQFLVENDNTDTPINYFNINAEQNKSHNKFNSDFLCNTQNSDDIHKQSQNSEYFGISSSDECISDSSDDTNDFIISNFFVDTITKAAEQQITQTENTKNATNILNESNETQNFEFKQTLSKSCNIELTPNQAKNKSNELQNIQTRKIEEIKQQTFQSFENALKEELENIEEAKKELFYIIENVTNESSDKFKDIKLNEIETIKKDEQNKIQIAKLNALRKIENTKNSMLAKIQYIRNEALSKLNDIKSESLLEINHSSLFNDFGINSSDESLSDEIDDDKDIIVPKYVVDVIINNAKQQLYSQADTTNK